MKYNFDKIIDRSGTDTIKLGRLKDMFGREDLMPLWVADMDFLSPPEITEALQKRTEHGVFGYTLPSEGYYKSIINWLSSQHNYNVNKEEITFVPGVVKAFAFAMDAFTKEGDNIIIQPPVYHPFRMVTEDLKRKVVNNPLILEDGDYKIDIEGLRKIISEKECKILIFCSPHNPVGRVWSQEELRELAEICYDNNILVVSDEIHSDFALFGNKHIPFATVSEKARENSITLMAPSKTFNIAGIVSSFALIHNKDIQQKYLDFLAPRELDKGTIYAYTATEAAYSQGGVWLEEAIDYIENNILFVQNYLEQYIPQIEVINPESMFLLWLDCRKLGLSQNDLVSLFVDKANLALNNGMMFGKEGNGFMRLNVGVPKSVLNEAMNRLRVAINN